jgi:hypothetical protein
MGFWFFLSVVVAGNMMLKAYKYKVSSRTIRTSDDRVLALELELKAVREKIQHLDEAVFFGDFELKRQFSELEKNMSATKSSR